MWSSRPDRPFCHNHPLLATTLLPTNLELGLPKFSHGLDEGHFQGSVKPPTLRAGPGLSIFLISLFFVRTPFDEEISNLLDRRRYGS